MSRNVIAGYMALTLYIADAGRNGTPEQRQRIKDEVLPLLRDPEVPIRDVLAKVDLILGDWELSGEFREAIDALLT